MRCMQEIQTVHFESRVTYCTLALPDASSKSNVDSLLDSNDARLSRRLTYWILTVWLSVLWVIIA